MLVADPDLVGHNGSPHPAGGVVDADFERVRYRLFGIAYQVLGRAAEAEDIVQDTWVKWHGADQAQVRDRVAFLVTITTRLSLNAATSARARREFCVGAALPEPVAVYGDPVLVAERGAALDAAVRLLLERLSPAERAAYVLREAFGYRFREIAAALSITEANARQVANRARRHLIAGRRRPVRPAEHAGLLAAFTAAARTGEMAGLLAVLAPVSAAA
ncbi:sigma factor-like helix-turn-helix DNA-binding protein [Actinocatenispora sera]|uniref:Uncharacterized protein n=1 Tax=Actinocatenispora sera TaxID=390989 RepID=A0A810L0M9_9ACTN|nr:sigma factor-like helix-turn-helix DNA-binding protein [Actinocatenispora sera]BCJ28465.1 hypothetical protein Asera_25730 [Actinocatenispora sera]